MISDEGEQYEFNAGVKTEGNVEDWMNNVDDMMIDTLHQIMKRAVFNYAKEERIIWCQEQLGMVTLAGTQIWWTWHVEDVFRKLREGENKHAMKEESAKETQQLNDIIEVIRNTEDPLIRKKINSLIIMDVHARDIVDSFVRDSITDAKEFEWEKQLRFLWSREADDIEIR
jgi:dynein heavy chain